MPETDLLVLHFHLDGWFDTGATSVAVSVARHHYNPTGGGTSRLSAREELMGYRSEVFLTEHIQEDLTMRMNKALSTFSTAMLLP